MPGLPPVVMNVSNKCLPKRGIFIRLRIRCYSIFFPLLPEQIILKLNPVPKSALNDFRRLLLLLIFSNLNQWWFVQEAVKTNIKRITRLNDRLICFRHLSRLALTREPLLCQQEVLVLEFLHDLFHLTIIFVISYPPSSVILPHLRCLIVVRGVILFLFCEKGWFVHLDKFLHVTILLCKQSCLRHLQCQIGDLAAFIQRLCFRLAHLNGGFDRN